MKDFVVWLDSKLKGADQILLKGRGLAKKHLQEHLATHRANTLAKKIMGLENFESFAHKTEKQLIARASKFFKSYIHFNATPGKSEVKNSLQTTA